MLGLSDSKIIEKHIDTKSHRFTVTLKLWKSFSHGNIYTQQPAITNLYILSSKMTFSATFHNKNYFCLINVTKIGEYLVSVCGYDTPWKVSKYGVISGHEIQEKQTRNNSVFGHFSCSVRYLTTDTPIFSLYVAVNLASNSLSREMFTFKLFKRIPCDNRY